MSAWLTYAEVQRSLDRLKLSQALVSLERLPRKPARGNGVELEFLGRLLVR
jgi:hypothetical protein